MVAHPLGVYQYCAYYGIVEGESLAGRDFREHCVLSTLDCSGYSIAILKKLFVSGINRYPNQKPSMFVLA